MIVNTVYNGIPFLLFQMYYQNGRFYEGLLSDFYGYIYYKKKKSLHIGMGVFNSPNSSYHPFNNPSAHPSLYDLSIVDKIHNNYGIEIDSFNNGINQPSWSYHLLNLVAIDYANDPNGHGYLQRIIKEDPFIVFDKNGRKIPHTMNLHSDGLFMMLHFPPHLDGFYNHRDGWKVVSRPFVDIDCEIQVNGVLLDYEDYLSDHVKNEDKYKYIDYSFIKGYYKKQSYVLSMGNTFVIPISDHKILYDNPFGLSTTVSYRLSFEPTSLGVYGDARHYQYLTNNKTKILEKI